MSKKIQVKFDNTLPDEEVRNVLIPSSIKEGGNINTGMSEVKITGIVAPLIKFNDKTIQWYDVLSFVLKCDKLFPTISLSFIDTQRVLVNLDTPGPDNHVIIELLPQFDGIYKKIKLKFYIDNINISPGNIISINGVYVCDKLNDSVLESFGKISTYKFIEEVAHRLRLGLCSNLDDSEDERYIYMDNITYPDALRDEVSMGGNPHLILDTWVDWWNNINIIDIYDAYNGTPDSDLEIWANNNWIDIDSNTDDPPVKIPATITNNYKMKHHPLYIDAFVVVSSNRGNTRRGTDRAINIFDINSAENDSILFQDGTGVKENVYTQYYYRGEFNQKDNDGSYLYQKDSVNLYKQKISNNLIRVCLSRPCFGLMRGGRVNLEWYDESDMAKEFYEMNEGVIEPNIPLEEDTSTKSDDIYDKYGITMNKKISGQYYIVDTMIEYTRENSFGGPRSLMKHYLTLSKVNDSYNYADATKNNNI